MNISGKKVYRSSVTLADGDFFIAMSDGCPHAGIGIAFNFGWKWEDIADFMRTIYAAGYTAKTLATMLVDECDKQYRYKPGDDALLLQGGKAHCMRRNHRIHRSGISRKAARTELEFRERGYSPDRGDRGR